MSIEKRKTLFGENKSILAMAGELFQNIPVKVKKSDVESILEDGILKAGTPFSADGKYVDGTTVTADKAAGLLYKDVNFTYSNGKESVSLTVFGFVKNEGLPASVTDSVKKALKMILFI